MALNEHVWVVVVVGVATAFSKEEYFLIFLEDICYGLSRVPPKFIRGNSNLHYLTTKIIWR